MIREVRLKKFYSGLKIFILYDSNGYPVVGTKDFNVRINRIILLLPKRITIMFDDNIIVAV